LDIALYVRAGVQTPSVSYIHFKGKILAIKLLEKEKKEKVLNIEAFIIIINAQVKY
jgi:hypothetical protein